MPAATPQATQNKVVDLYKAGKTYSEIEKATGCRGYTISAIVKKAGLTRKSVAAPASSPAQPPATAPPAASQPISSTPSAQALADLQPPAPPVAKKTQAYRCDACSGIFALDDGESIDSVTCPHCGGKP